MKKKRIWIIIGLVVVLTAGGIYLLTTRQTANGQGGLAQLAANAQTAKVIRTTLANSVDSSGSIIPQATVQLSFGTAGTVDQVKVKVGDRVKAGDVLATLDSSDLQDKLDQAQQAYIIQQLTYSSTVEASPSDVAVAQASYASALASYNAALTDYSGLADKQTVQCAQLTSAQDALDRAQAAYDRLANDHQASQYLNADWGPFRSVVNNLTNAQSAYELAQANCNIAKTGLNDSALRSAKAQLESAKANLDSLLSPRSEKQIQAQAQLEQARLSLEQAKLNLAKATLTAPFAGIITAVNITPGSAAGSGAAVTLVDDSQLHVDVLVDETMIAQVKPGQAVDITLDALQGITLTGKVARIDPVGTVTQGVVNYNVRVNLDPIDNTTPVRLDMTANASILGEKHENVLAVPTSAIRNFGGNFAGGAANGGSTGQGGRTNGQGQSGASGQTDQQNGQTGQRVRGPMVLVVENGQVRPVAVTEGLTVGDLTEVSGDLKEGDVVIVGTLTTPTGGNNNFRGGFFPGGGPGAGGRPPF